MQAILQLVKLLCDQRTHFCTSALLGYILESSTKGILSRLKPFLYYLSEACLGRSVHIILETFYP